MKLQDKITGPAAGQNAATLELYSQSGIMGIKDPACSGFCNYSVLYCLSRFHHGLGPKESPCRMQIGGLGQTWPVDLLNRRQLRASSLKRLAATDT